MDISYIKEFLDLAQTCNYQETSLNMNLAISSLSKHISQLENNLGVKLFDRTSRSVKLNTYGEVFWNYAQRIVDAESDGRQAISALKNAETVSLKIGYMPIMDKYRIPDLIMDFRLDNPGTELEMTEKPRIEDLLKENDFVFSEHTLENNPDVKSLLFFEDHLVVLFPSDHLLAGRDYVTVGDLRDDRFIAHGSSKENIFIASVMFNKLAKEAGYTPDIVLTSTSIPAVTRLVKERVGIAVINKQPGLDFSSMGISIVDLYPTQYFRIYLLYSANRRISGIKKKFLDYVEERAMKPLR